MATEEGKGSSRFTSDVTQTRDKMATLFRLLSVEQRSIRKNIAIEEMGRRLTVPETDGQPAFPIPVQKDRKLSYVKRIRMLAYRQA